MPSRSARLCARSPVGTVPGCSGEALTEIAAAVPPRVDLLARRRYGGPTDRGRATPQNAWLIGSSRIRVIPIRDGFRDPSKHSPRLALCVRPNPSPQSSSIAAAPRADKRPPREPSHTHQRTMSELDKSAKKKRKKSKSDDGSASSSMDMIQPESTTPKLDTSKW